MESILKNSYFKNIIEEDTMSIDDKNDIFIPGERDQIFDFENDQSLGEEGHEIIQCNFIKLKIF